MGVIIIAARELSVTVLRTIAISEGVVIAASRGGKEKTAVQMVAVLTLILHYTYYIDWGFHAGLVNMNAVGSVLLYLSVFFTLTSAGEYVALLVDAVEAKDRRLAEGTKKLHAKHTSPPVRAPARRVACWRPRPRPPSWRIRD